MEPDHTPDARRTAPRPRARYTERVTYDCAFCGEANETFVDPSGGPRQRYTEDCTVCCRPNLITIGVDDDGEPRLEVAQEYEA